MRWEHEAAIERHRARMQDPGAQALIKQRAALAEHPFGTLKCRAGWRHFLVRGFNKVRGEWSLMALCYNFTRVLNILGMDRFKDYLDKRRAALLRLCFVLIAAILASSGLVGRSSACPTKNPPKPDRSAPWRHYNANPAILAQPRSAMRHRSFAEFLPRPLALL